MNIEERVEKAKKLFKEGGYNCCQAVVLAYNDLFGLSDELAASIASGFGGGMGHTKNTCGAITGAVMALSSIVGRENPMAKESMADRVAELQQGIYPVVGKMVNEMEETYGTLICSELSNPHGDWEGKARKKNCMAMITECAGLAAKYAEEYLNENK